MDVPPPPRRRFNPPPGWPTPPPGWTAPQGWAPDPSWPPPPAGWQFWVDDPRAGGVERSTGTGVAVGRSLGLPRWVVAAGALVCGIIIAAAIPGVLGHVFAFIIWATAAWFCIKPARASVGAAVRTWARIGVAAFACLAVYAGSLAVISATTAPNWYANGYNFNAAYIAQEGTLSVNDGFWCNTEVGQSSAAGIATNSPGGYGASAQEWIDGCEAGLYAGVGGFPPRWPSNRPAPKGS